jgi:hypothetical protein
MSDISSAYRGVRVTIWNDDKFFTMSDDGKLVWFHAYTNAQTNGLGLYHATVEGLSANMRWPLERYRKGFAEGLAKGLFNYDETYQCLYFPAFLKYNKPSNPNVLTSLIKAWPYIPETPYKAMLHKDLKGLGDAFAKVMLKVPLKVYPKTDETVTRTVTGTVTGTVSKPTLPRKELSTEVDPVTGEILNWGDVCEN